jgi:hypothetical protein
MGVRELAPEERQELGERWQVVLVSAPEGVRGDLVCSGRAPQAQVDPTGVQLLEHAELLDNGQRRVIGQHHATGADAQPRGSGSDVCDQDRR